MHRGQINRMARRTSRSLGEIVRANVLTRFNALLGSLCVVVLAVGTWRDALFGGVLVANSLIGIVQELRAKRKLDHLALLQQPRVHVRRSGQTSQIDMADIVVDDLIEIHSGDQVVVDGVVVAADGLEIDESLLTGESDPQTKASEQPVLSGSFVVAGHGMYRATSVGPDAYAHRLAAQAQHFVPPHSELGAGINRILRYVGWAIAPVSALLLMSQLLRQAPLAQAVLFSTGGVVGMVPEGLVLLTSFALAVGAVRLAQRGALVQELPAIETLARVDVICLDKTGTLTEGEPTMERVELLVEHRDALDALAALALGDPAPNATLQAIASRYSMPLGWVASGAVPFSSARKWAGASFGEFGTWVLGAPDVILAGIADEGDVRQVVSGYAEQGRRVLLLAHARTSLADKALPPDCKPVALVLLIERIRDDAAATLAYFAAQGVSVKVISGDHPGTVAEVARRVGMPDVRMGVDARELPDDPARLQSMMEQASVFGRVSPQQKKAMLAALRAGGHVVAMIGDGVNDLLALKEADISIAMGGGSSAARAVAQAVLVDNRFASLPAIVGEGRRVIGNVERLATLFVTKTVYAMLLAFSVGVADLAFPFLPRHLTLVGSLTIGIPAFFLSLEASAERARSGFVERVLRFAVPAGVLAAISTFASYSITLSYLGGTLDQARSASATVLFGVTLWILALLARPLTLLRVTLVAAMAATFAAVAALPPLRGFFVLETLPLRIWLGAAVVAVLACSGMVGITARAGPAHPPSHDEHGWRIRSIPHALLRLWHRHVLLFTSAALFIVASGWLFLGVLEDVLAKDPLVQIDLIVYRYLQDARLPSLDSVLVAASELGDAAVILPVVLVVLAWFIWRRLWQSAIYWLAAIGGAEIIVKLLMLALHRAQPNPFSSGAESFSFPSSHATLSVVAYGFLAFLLCRAERPGVRTAVVLTAALAIALIALSRLYLGVHWVSDVLAGISFGLAWIAVLAIAYVLRVHENIQPERLALMFAATLATGGSLHIVRQHAHDLALYAPSRSVTEMTGDQWASAGWQALPVGRRVIPGEIDEPFTVQWVGTTAPIEAALRAAGWKAAPGWSPLAILDDWLGRVPSSVANPVRFKFHEGSPAKMVFVRLVSPETRLVIRLWPSGFVIGRPGGAPSSVPIWVGSVRRERVADARALPFSGPPDDDDFSASGSTLAQQFPDARWVTRNVSPLPKWDRRVLLLCSKESLACPRP
ncbi:HAD-IC family P-type ATPase [Caballeronia arationis]|uniref:HAD-IC family P-type ATPase n=1 Tax=Caballeronia arationis TaxID=1777142 RepID=UPI001F2C7053|nr:HAD-IC family P-type ATPase [Caballeronia arationis]